MATADLTVDLIYRTTDRLLALLIYDTVRGMGDFMIIELRSQGDELRVLAVPQHAKLNPDPQRQYDESLRVIKGYASGIAVGWNSRALRG